MSAPIEPQWRPIADWPNYEVSDQGQVRSLPRERTRGGILRPYPNSGQYLAVALSRGPEVKRFRIHKLVAETFIGPCPPGQEVRHLNDVKHDNRLVNLAYGTRKENKADEKRNGVRSRPRWRAPREKKPRPGPRSHCRRQHLFTPESSWIGPDGKRRCRTCVADRYQQRKAAAGR